VWDGGCGWRGSGSLDVGGFGIGNAAAFPWQAVAEVEYAFTARWSPVAGYRHLSVDRSVGGRDRNQVISGNLIGVRARV
jgi:hypothetical protein